LTNLLQVKGGVAEADGRLMQGDQIMAVNGEDMRSATQEYAAGVLKVHLHLHLAHLHLHLEHLHLCVAHLHLGILSWLKYALKKKMGLGRVVREVRYHPKDNRFESQWWQ
jgi:hypothetical protein